MISSINIPKLYILVSGSARGGNTEFSMSSETFDLGKAIVVKQISATWESKRDRRILHNGNDQSCKEASQILRGSASGAPLQHNHLLSRYNEKTS